MQQETAEASAGTAFLHFDRRLDAQVIGPLWLKEPRIAQAIIDALRFGEEKLGLYDLIAYVVMANHVHVLIRPHAPLPKVMRAIKGFTAREANKILGRSGQRFWQEEFFDHWVRNDGELRRIIRYIESNPVSAGFVERPEDWPWSSAGR